MQTYEALASEARTARREFETTSVDQSLLVRLFKEYSPGPGAEDIVNSSLRMFPDLSCGVASVYLRHKLRGGNIIEGGYARAGTSLVLPHTFIVIDSLLADITADQFGGPSVYVGPITSPWQLRE